jgi:hypothetical protein
VFRFDRALKLLLETGPSLRGRSLSLHAVRPDGGAPPVFFTVIPPSGIITVPARQVVQFTVTSPSMAITMPVKGFVQPGEMSADIMIGHELQFSERAMPYDDRLLIYRVSDCELVSEGQDRYTEAMKRVLGTSWRENGNLHPEDIVDSRDHDALALGTGWFQREVESGSTYRWMADGAEIVLDGGALGGRSLEIRGQVGPSALSQRITILGSLNGTPIMTQEVAYRGGAQVRLSFDSNSPLWKNAWRNGQNVISLSTKGGEKAIPGDPRLLNFRVFHIGLLGMG